MCILFNRLVMSRLEVVYSSFFQFWLIFPNPSYQSHSKEYHFNWCWHRTLPLKKEKILYLRKFASGTTTKVLSCLKIPLTSMRFIASCENVVPRFQTSQFFPSLTTPRTGLFNPLEETLLQPVLKSFITVFIIMRS